MPKAGRVTLANLLYKKPIKEACMNGVSSWITTDPNLQNAGWELMSVDHTSFVIRVPGMMGPRRFVVKVTEQI